MALCVLLSSFRPRLLRVAAGAVVLLSMLADRSPAATFIWSGAGANDNWTTAANWVGGIAPTGSATDDLVFPTSPRLSPTNNFPGGTTFGSLSLAGGGYAVGGNALSLVGGLSSSTGSNAISPAVTLAAPLTVDVADGTLTLNAGFGAGAQALTKTGDGALVLAASSTRSGTTTVSAGRLQLTNAAGLGTGAVTVAGGTLASNAAASVANPVTLAGGGIAAIGGDRTFGGAIAVAAGSTISLADALAPATARGLALTGVLSGSGALSVSAPVGSTKTLGVLNSSSTFTGDMILDAAARVTVAAGATWASRVSGGGAVAFNGANAMVTSVSGASNAWSGDVSWGGGSTGRATTTTGSIFPQKFRLQISAGDALGSDATVNVSGGSGLTLDGGAVWGSGGRTILPSASQRGNVLGAAAGGGRFDGTMVWTESNGSLFAIAGGTLEIGAGAVLDNRLTGSNYQFVTVIGDGTVRFASGFDADAYEGTTVAGNLLGWGSTVRHHEGTVEVRTAGRWWASGYQMANHGTDLTPGGERGATLRIDVTTAHPSQATFAKTDAAQTLDVTAGHTWTIASPGAFAVGSGATLTKTGAGRVVVGAVQQHGSGALLRLAAGSLLIDSAAGTNPLAVQLDGAATIGGGGGLGSLAGAGTVAPGDDASVGVLTADSADLSGATLRVRVAGFGGAGVDSDRLESLGALVVDGNTRLVLDLAGLASGGTATGVVTGAALIGAIDPGNVSVVNDGVGFTVALVHTATGIDVQLAAPTPTATDTATATDTPTATATSTDTPTAVDTDTPTPMATATATVTLSATPTVTASSTPTPTATVAAGCGNGRLDGGEACDDGNSTDGDGCGTDCVREACYACAGEPSLCVAAPRLGCRRPAVGEKARLVLRGGGPPSRNKLVWKWLGGAATAAGDFGDPLTDTAYELCVFDRRAGIAALAGGYTIPAGRSWSAKSGGKLRYRDPAGSGDGIALVNLRPGPDGKARCIVAGKGASLASPVLPLAGDPEVLVQFGHSGACWESIFSTPRKSTATRYQAKADP